MQSLTESKQKRSSQTGVETEHVYRLSLLTDTTGKQQEPSILESYSDDGYGNDLHVKPNDKHFHCVKNTNLILECQ